MQQDDVLSWRMEVAARLNAGERVYLQKVTPGGHLKAWSVEVNPDGSSLTIWFGRAGAFGQTRPVECGSRQVAISAGIERAVQKLKEGYRILREDESDPGLAATQPNEAMAASFSCASRAATNSLIEVVRSKAEVVAKVIWLMTWQTHTVVSSEKVEIGGWRVVLNSKSLLPGESMISVLDCAGSTSCRRSRDSLVMLMLLAVRKAAPDGVIVRLTGSGGQVLDPSPQKAIEELVADGVRFRELELFVRALRLDNSRSVHALLQEAAAGDGFWF